MFFLASSRCSAGDPVSAPGAEESPFVKREGLIAMLDIWLVVALLRIIVKGNSEEVLRAEEDKEQRTKSRVAKLLSC